MMKGRRRTVVDRATPQMRQTRRTPRSGWLPRTCVLGALLVLSVALLTACIPSNRSEVEDIDDGSDSARGVAVPPSFPTTGEIPADLLVEGLVHDFTTRPRDQDYWSPPTPQAQCAAEAIVVGVGPSRLSTLGYRVATPGASLNDIALTDAERSLVIDEFGGCVDMVQAVASLLFGDGRMPTTAATCVARGLGGQQMLRPFTEAWAFGRAVDPFASDGALASALLAESQICISASAFDWPNVRLPEDEPLIDSDAPAGSAGSAFEDDRRATGATTTTTSPASPTTTTRPEP